MKLNENDYYKLGYLWVYFIDDSVEPKSSTFALMDFKNVDVTDKTVLEVFNKPFTKKYFLENIETILEDDESLRHFLRGYYDSVFDPSCFYVSLEHENDSTITRFQIPRTLCTFLTKRIKQPHKLTRTGQNKDFLSFEGVNSLDFKGWLYSNCNLKSHNNYGKFLELTTIIQGINTEVNGVGFEFTKLRPDAIAPTKTNVSDSGYDLHVLEKVKQVGEVEYYDTGIAVKPPFGWYFALVARSSLSKTGYILANSIGIIDQGYRDSIKVPLIKVDREHGKLPELPYRAVQIVPMPIIHMIPIEKETLDESKRNKGGFGSTGEK